MNPGVILALISELYAQVGKLTDEKRALEQRVAELAEAGDG